MFGGSIPTTLTEEWADETLKLSAAKPREGSDQPISMNPFKHAYPPDMDFEGVRVPGGWTVRREPGSLPKRSKSASYLAGYGQGPKPVA